MSARLAGALISGTLLAVSGATGFAMVTAGSDWGHVIAGGGRPIAVPVQAKPSTSEIANYKDLLAAVGHGNHSAMTRLIAAGTDLNQRDQRGRTPLMVAAHRRDLAAVKTLVAAGANLDALDAQHYDVLTISGVLGDEAIVNFAIKSGANTGLITSPYEGTALIASAHLGHVGVVRALIKGGAPVNHINNLNWTALIEAIVLGDGGARYIACVGELISGGADVNLADGNGVRPLTLARQRGYDAIAALIEKAGGR